jgi:integrase/recombinase XerD
MKEKFDFKEFKNELKLRCYSIKTIDTYLFFNKKLLEFTKKSPKEVTKSDIRKYILNMIEKYGAKPATVNLAVSSFKMYYKDFMKRKFLNDIKRARSEKTSPVYLTKEEILEMINKTKNIKHKLLIELLYSSGLRASEAIKLKIEDIYFKEKYLIVKKGKGKKDRYVLTSKLFINDLIKFLEKRVDENPYIFISNHNKDSHVTYKSAQKIIKTAAKKAKIKRRVFPHALRSSFATQLYRDGTDIFNIQKLLGHEDIRTTKGYTKTDFNMLNSVTSPLD